MIMEGMEKAFPVTGNAKAVTIKMVHEDDMDVSSELVLIREYKLRILVDGIERIDIVCTPTNLRELILGRLMTEGIIRSARDAALTMIREDEGVACVSLKRANDGPAAYSILRKPVNRVYEIPWDHSWIWTLEERFNKDTRLHKKTHATHSCFLMRSGKILHEAEDIGRHNAIDKVVGWALLNRVPLEECILYTTGRMPVDMVLKVVRAGIPVMVSKEVPTLEGLHTAQQYGLTLICGLKHGKMNVFYGYGDAI